MGETGNRCLGVAECTVSSLATVRGPGEWALSLLVLTIEAAGEGGSQCKQLSSHTGVPARRLSRDSTAADVRLSSSCF